MMKLARTLLLPTIVVSALSTSLFACDKGKGGGSSGGGGTGAAGAAAIAPTKGGLKGALAAMPKETEMVIGIDFGKARSSAIYKKYEPLLMEKIGKELEEFKSKCGFDPKEKLAGILLGSDLPQGGGGPNNATAFIRGFEKGPSLECLKKAAAESQAKGENKTATIDGDYVELMEDGAVEMRGMFIDDNTFLLIKQGDNYADKAALTAASNAKEGEGLTSSAAFVKLLDEVKTGSAMFYVINGNAGAIAQAPMPFKIKAVFGWFNVGGDLSGEAHLRMESSEDASAAVGLYKMGVGEAKKTPAGKFIDAVKVSAKGSDAVATFKFSQGQIDEMVEMAKSF
jgi:hypothetical protein